jgi:Domain of unknown function (DUF4395)
MAITPRAQRNFILQQGLPEPDARACPLQYSALLFQPRLVALILAAAVVLQAPLIFYFLAAVLWFSAAVPRLNPFDALYNRSLARSGGVSLSPARAPRRFAQFMAGSFAIAIGVFLAFGWHTTAYVLEGVFVAAVAALAFGAFCFGSFVFHLISGRAAFAARTLPWARSV